MRKLGIFWFAHFVATVAGWYVLAALAQGAVDSAVEPTLPLVAFNGLIQLLCFPVVLAAVSLYPAQIGGFSAGSFAAFACLAAVNSALVSAILAGVVRALKSHSERSA